MDEFAYPSVISDKFSSIKRLIEQKNQLDLFSILE